MPKRMQWLVLIWAATLFLFLPGPIGAQQAPAATQDSEDEENVRPTSVASLTVTLFEGDRIHVNFYTTVESSNRTENLAAVEAALGCKVELDSRFARVRTVLAAWGLTADLRATFRSHRLWATRPSQMLALVLTPPNGNGHKRAA